MMQRSINLVDADLILSIHFRVMRNSQEPHNCNIENYLMLL